MRVLAESSAMRAMRPRPVLTRGLHASAPRPLFARRPVHPVRKVSSAVTSFIFVLGGAAFALYSLDSRAAVHRWVVSPLMRAVLDAETAAEASIKVLKYGLGPRDCGVDDERLRTQLFGRELTNPIGLAAGFDKQGEAIDGLFDLGFGIVEIGSVTPLEQPGNPRPRMFRLSADRAVINRMGFNSQGHEPVYERLHERVHSWALRVLASGRALLTNPSGKELEVDTTALGVAQQYASYPESSPELLDKLDVPRSLKAGRLLSINLGKNKASPEASVEDYVKGVYKLGPYADMLVVNVSSPNTPGLRGLQRRDALAGLLREVVSARDVISQSRPTALPLVVKVAPDLSEAELNDVADAATEAKIDGIIVSNTTISRPVGLLSTEHVNETGGLSGRPLKPLAIRALETIYARTDGKITLIGAGGISSGQDALDFCRAGASAVQLYTALGYYGPGLPRRIKDELAQLLAAGNTTWKDSIGAGARKSASRPYEGDVESLGLYPGAQDAFDRSVASVKSEITRLREAFTDIEATERRELPFSVDADDDKYAKLLEDAHKALDDKMEFVAEGNTVLPSADSSIPQGLAAIAASEGRTIGEVLHDAAVEATKDTVVGVEETPKDIVTSIGGLQAERDTSFAQRATDPTVNYRAVDKQRVI
ncbi:hypothetical protein MCUN1_001473 [Malassezia cuniculi]|uniref:Dihydroorotate dehydrogenase (quinone), mitochondrial n=1 Tax=Malassezia cuniculi TaxID=948313 RepID=A0AAF0J5L9_9BASI|nr:hypothetical protein MCUN1_001473 [Malassezia cuniculi]